MIAPFHVTGTCVASDETLFEYIRLALLRGLPAVDRLGSVKAEPVAIVGSGPSLAETWEKLQTFPGPIVAVRDAHDFLIARGLTPQYALSVDPLETAASCFRHPHPDVRYMIASQSHPRMLDALDGYNVTLFHLLMKQGQTYPPNVPLIGGGTTSGLRAITLFWTLGYRDFHLFGMDSCVDGARLRVNGDAPNPKDELVELRLTENPDAETFYCTPAMALQAHSFQDLFDQIPDCRFTAYGRGLITAILAGRERQWRELSAVVPEPDRGTVSFIHSGDASMASWRYRAAQPAAWLGARLNDLTASTLVFAKPHPRELLWMAAARRAGKRVVIDICDDHFDRQHYQEALKLAHIVTCSTDVLAERIQTLTGYTPTVIPESWEFDECAPHASGRRVLWFGHAVNRESLERVRADLAGFELHVVGNFEGAIPWSLQTMAREFQWADAVILPAAAAYKSANRAVEAIRQGCFVVAEPHPSLRGFPALYTGSIQKGLEWMTSNLSLANHHTSLNQSFVTATYTPRTMTALWRTVTRLPITSDAAASDGPVGSTSILTAAAI